MKRSLPFIMLALATLFLMFSNLGNQFLWQDEAQTGLIARTVLATGIPKGHDGRNSFSQELGAEYDKNGVFKWHPWLPFYVLAFFYRLFGITTFVSRLPFVLFGIATILATYILARALWRHASLALLAATFLVLTISFLILSRQCRYYSMTAFFFVLGTWGYVKMCRREGGGSWIFFLGNFLLFHTQSIYCFTILLTSALHALIFRRREFVRIILVSLSTVVINIPWIMWTADITWTAYRSHYGPSIVNLPVQAKMLYEFLKQLTFVFPPELLVFPVLVLLKLRSSKSKTSNIAVNHGTAEGISLLLLQLLVTSAALAASAPAPFFRYLTPLIPVCSLLIAFIVVSSGRVHIVLGVIAALVFLGHQPITRYLYEITHDYDGPIEGIVTYLNRHSATGDTVAITYGDLPVKFYTSLAVVGGLTGEDLSPAREARWVIIRKHIISSKDLAVREYFLKYVPLYKYRPIEINYPDIPFENRESPTEHLFRTAANGPKVILFERMQE